MAKQIKSSYDHFGQSLQPNFKRPEKKKIEHPERAIQRACVKWFRLQYPNYILFAVPNGGSRHAWEAANLKLEGVTAGVPDLIVCLPTRTVFIELKAGKGVISEKQKEVIQRLRIMSHSVWVCYSVEEFQDAIKTELKYTNGTELTYLNGTDDVNH